MADLFIADLHLSPVRPAKFGLFLEFLAVAGRRRENLYILGDLVDAWLGDDDDSVPAEQLVDALAAFSERGGRLAVMHGNHDFLFGERFASRTGCDLLEDPVTVTLASEPVVLTHGDLLCTEDHAYQELRKMVRSAEWQANALAKSLDERRAIAADIRATSVAESTQKDRAAMDVTDTAVRAMLDEFDAATMIHGHTHRPAVHEFEHGGRPCRRFVLQDWYEDDGVLVWDEAGPRMARVAQYLER